MGTRSQLLILGLRSTRLNILISCEASAECSGYFETDILKKHTLESWFWRVFWNRYFLLIFWRTNTYTFLEPYMASADWENRSTSEPWNSGWNTKYNQFPVVLSRHPRNGEISPQACLHNLVSAQLLYFQPFLKTNGLTGIAKSVSMLTISPIFVASSI